MIDQLIEVIHDGIRYVRDHPQLVFTLVLIVVIPAAFIINAQQFLRLSQDNQQRLERERTGLLQDAFEEIIRNDSNDAALLQRAIDNIVRANTDITNFKVGTDDASGIRIIAAQNRTQVGQNDPNPDTYNIARVEEGRSVSVLVYDNGTHFWQTFRVIGLPGRTTYYLFTETSAAQDDAIFANKVKEGYYWLFGLLAIVLLLVLRHVRLIDYGYLYRQAKHANEMKDLFTNMIAHELRAPLTAIRGYASMLYEDNTLDFKIREKGKIIEESSARLMTIINDLLDIARIQSGKLSITKEPTDASKVVTRVTSELSALVAEHGVSLSHTGTHDPHIVLGDEKRLFQALTNLVSNAIKYTREGSVQVAIEERKDRVEIRVKDTGMGISAEDQKKLFAPFFRVDRTDVSNITGTGLGMWITKELIELMGGSVAVESIRGVGTHVVVTLPKLRVDSH